MDWKLHAEAYPAMWIFKLISPREALWRSIVTTWLSAKSFRCTDIFQNMSSTRKQQLLSCIPKKASYLRTAITNFWDLKLRPKVDWEKIRPELAEAQQLFENHHFSTTKNSAVMEFWRGAGFEHLKDVLSPRRTILTKSEIASKLALVVPISGPTIRYRTGQLIRLIDKIPAEIISAITKQIEAIAPEELICWQAYDPDPRLNDEGWRYGQTLIIQGSIAIQELYVDSSGVPSPVGDPHLPHHDSFPASWSDTHRLAIWGNPKSKGKKFIRGRMDNTTVPNEHWLFLEEKEGIRLSEFSISRITKAKQLRNTERPRCEKKWKTLLQDDTIDFDKVWGSVGTFLTSPAQEKHWFLLLHRNLLFRTADKREPSNRCRLCNFWKENQLHFLGCRKLAAVRNLVYQLLSAMGVQRSVLNSKKAWLTGLSANNELIPEACRALLRIYINVTYRNMTLVVAENLKFNSWRVQQEICRDFMSSILAYQKERHEFYLKRALTPLQHILPKKAVTQAAPIGELNPETGLIKINPGIEAIMKRFRVWTTFSRNAH